MSTPWLAQHIRGDIYRLGRLQFNFSHLTFELGDPGLPYERNEPALGVHIPATGPLHPEECEEAFEAARHFFPKHFPERPRRLMTCSSWLLDDQLGCYLSPSANILAFQRRFTLAPGSRDGDEDVLRFVFGHVPATLDGLVAQTSLERAVISHLRSGRHWAVRHGWMPVCQTGT